MWVVCQNKDDGKLFISSRKVRETMLSVLIDLGQEIPSKVLKEFNFYDDAKNYEIEFNRTNNDINKILNQ